jgi:hypothetical protein
VFSFALGRSSWVSSVLGIELGDAREGYWSWCSETLALLGY